MTPAKLSPLFRLCATLLLAGTVTVAAAAAAPAGRVGPWAKQLRPCTELTAAERESARLIGMCRDVAPVVDVAPKEENADAEPAVVVPVPNVVGLNFDDARARMSGFTLRRSYRPSAEPGGTVLEQQPAPPARVTAGATVNVVLSDASLRPAPRVPSANVDEVPRPLAANSDPQQQPPVSADRATPGQLIAKSPAARLTQPNGDVVSKGSVDRAVIGADVELPRVPNVVGTPVQNAQTRMWRFKIERRNRPSDAPIGQVIEQIPKAWARAAAGSAIVLVVSSGPAPVTEIFEVPNVINRSYTDARSALAEFKMDGIDVVASAAPSGQVLAQNPAPGTLVAAGSVIRLQVSDGSLASAAAITPAVVVAPSPASALVPAPAPAPDPIASAPTASAPESAPVQVDRSPATLEGSLLAIIATALLVLGLVVLAIRGWLVNRRQPAIDVEPVAQLQFTPTEIDISAVPMGEIRFSARLDEGETTIEFAASTEDEATLLEHSRELHE